MEWIASTLYTTKEHGVSSITTADAHTSAELTNHADLNGLGHFAGRRNLVSVRVPSLFKRSLLNPLKPELNPICYFLALLVAHHFLHVSRIRVKSLTFRRLMSYIYIYMEHPFLMFLDHTQRRSTVGRTPLDE